MRKKELAALVEQDKVLTRHEEEYKHLATKRLFPDCVQSDNLSSFSNLSTGKAKGVDGETRSAKLADPVQKYTAERTSLLHGSI